MANSEALRKSQKQQSLMGDAALRFTDMKKAIWREKHSLNWRSMGGYGCLPTFSWTRDFHAKTTCFINSACWQKTAPRAYSRTRESINVELVQKHRPVQRVPLHGL